MITTLIPINGSGKTFFTGSVSLGTQTLHENMLNSNILLLSDQILIDALWRHPYKELNTNDLPQYRLIEHLIERNVIKEVEPSHILDLDECNKILSSSVSSMCTDLENLGFVPCSDETKGLIDTNPVSVINNINQGSTHKTDHILDVILMGISSEHICNRVNDTTNELQFYYHLTKNLTEDAELVTDEHDWLIQVCHQYLPSVPIFQTRENKEARLEHPLEGIFNDLVKVNMGGDNRDVADVTESLRNIDTLLSIRDSNQMKDLRTTYMDLAKKITSGAIEYDSLPVGNILEKDWHCARTEMINRMRNINKYDWWTDVITIPAALASVPLPLVGGIPLLTWAVSKVKTKKVSNNTEERYPWFFTIEQVKFLESKIISEAT